MTDSDDKKRWKEESKLLKEDLDKREKKTVKREVSIKFPKKPPKHSPADKSPIGDKTLDDYLKQQINIE